MRFAIHQSLKWASSQNYQNRDISTRPDVDPLRHYHVVRRTEGIWIWGIKWRHPPTTNASPSSPTYHPVAVRHIRWHPSSTCRKNHQNISSLKPSPQMCGPSRWAFMGCWWGCFVNEALLSRLTRKFRDNFRSQKRKIEWSSMWQYNRTKKKQTSGWSQNLLDTASTILPIWPVWGAFC